jgi:hypothetical protein
LTRQSILLNEALLSMDALVKPGHDESKTTAGAMGAPFFVLDAPRREADRQCCPIQP